MEKINDGLSKWQRYRLRLKEKGIINKHNKRDSSPIDKRKYRLTKRGRAFSIIHGYKKSDKNANRGECTLTAEWVVENIFNGQTCHYCGETDWRKLGCDRINNDLPHTPDNVVPCCKPCNDKRGTKSYEKFLKENG